jgi:tRNA pseudouridine55 synthase
VSAAESQPRYDGVLNLFKPTGITSAKAVYRTRSLTGIRKSGHAGTLDPGADGVLLVCMGKATKSVERLMSLPKTYEARGRLDVTSRSLDSDSPHEPVLVETPPSAEALEAAAARWIGEVQQVPPAVSAIKVDGVRAYRRVRRGQEPTMKPRSVLIHDLQITHYEWPEVAFMVRCGRGTYVRSIIRDLGEAVLSGGCLTALRRTAVGPFTSDSATHFEELEAGLFDARRIDLEDLHDLLDTKAT